MEVYKNDFPMENLNKLVFSQEPLHSDEILVACTDESIRKNMTKGKLLTNQAFLTWTDKEVKRFPLENMKGVEILEDKNNTWGLRFIINGRLTTLRGIPDDGFRKSFVTMLSEDKYMKTSETVTEDFDTLERKGKPISFSVELVNVKKSVLSDVLDNVSLQKLEKALSIDDVEVVSGEQGALNIYPTHLNISFKKSKAVNAVKNVILDQMLESGNLLGTGLGLFYKSTTKDPFYQFRFKWNDISWIKFEPKREEFYICARTDKSERNLVFVGKSYNSIDLLRKLDNYAAVEGIPSSPPQKSPVVPKKQKGPGIGLAILGLLLGALNFLAPILFIFSIPLCIYIVWKAKGIIPKIIAVLGILVSLVTIVIWAGFFLIYVTH